MSPLHNQQFTVFGGVYVPEHHDSLSVPGHRAGFNVPADSKPGSLAPWGAVLCTLLVAATTLALKTTTAAMANVTLLASLN
jgi:hypothetical protein